MHPRVLVTAVAALLCAACGTPSYTTKNVESDYRFEKRPGSGLVIISTRVSSECEMPEGHSKPQMMLHYVDDSFAEKKTGVIPVMDWYLQPDFQDPPGYLSVRELRAGQHYLINDLVVYGDQPNDPWNRTPFTVEEGKAVYLGEVLFRFSRCLPGAHPKQVIISNQWERDGELLQQRMKHVRPEDVVIRLLPELRQR